jgi:hypothetical protein
MLVIMNSNAALLFMVTPFFSQGMACKDEVGHRTRRLPMLESQLRTLCFDGIRGMKSGS